MTSLGFPRMHKEESERRAFLPDFFAALEKTGLPVALEKGYGSRLGFEESDYLGANKHARIVTQKEAFAQDVVTVLRSPEVNELKLMKRGAVLLSMLHYPTRAIRVELLKKRGIRGVSLDSLRDDFLQRIVYNPKGTSENGMEIAFKELAKVRKNFFSPRRLPLRVSIIGMGMIGLRAARSAGKYGSPELNDLAAERGARGVIVRLLPRSVTADRKLMEKLLKTSDILVDASTRDNPYAYIIDNDQLGQLKPDAVILDLTADPYLVDDAGVQVKAFEGIPTGDLNKPVFYPDDPAYDAIPAGVRTANRRTVVSCNAWPGVKPEECMRLYGIQILPILTALAAKDLGSMTIDSPDYFERAIARATVEYFERYDKPRS